MSRRAYERRKQKLADGTITRPTTYTDTYLTRTYGINHAILDTLMARQFGRCAICGTDAPGGPGKRFHVDHCHATNKVRGLLCSKCNIGLGAFNDSVPRLFAAINYLNEFLGRPRT